MISTPSTHANGRTYSQLRAMELAVVDGPVPIIAPADEQRLRAADPELGPALPVCRGIDCADARPCDNCTIRRRYLALLLHRERHGRVPHPAANGDGHETAAAPKPPARRLDRYRPFPVHYLPDGIREYVAETAAALGCDASYVALPCLTVAASCIGNSRSIELKRGWTEPAVIWAGIVGDSGTLKTPAYHAAVAGLYAVQRRWLAQYQTTLTEYQIELERWEAARKRKMTDAGPRPEHPTCRRAIVSDITIERLAVILAENPRGVLVARDELAGWLASFSRYKGKSGGTDLPNWLEMFRAGTIMVDRKTSEPRTLYVHRAAASIVGGIQPGALARALTADGGAFLDCGLAARLLLAYPPKRRKAWSELSVDPDTRRAWEGLIDSLLSLEMERDGDGELAPVALTLDAEARAGWVEWYADWAAQQEAAEGDYAAVLSKLEAYAARLALVHHVCSAAVHQVASSFVGLDSVIAGCTLSEWFAGEARRIYGMLTETTDQRDTRRLAEWIEGRGGAVTVRELHRSNQRRYPTAEDAETALSGLVEAGHGEWVTEGPGERRGKPSLSFRLSVMCDSDNIH